MPSKTVKQLEPMFHPESVAIIGASNKKRKIGNTILKNMAESGYKGKVFPINPKEEQIMGHRAYKTISEVKSEIDLAVLCIPSKYCVPIVEECGSIGVKTMVIITAGFKEIGGDGLERENNIVEIGKKYGMRILGPNCLGLSTNGNFSFSSFTPKRGKIGFLSQSGAMLTGLIDWAVDNDIGFSSFISLGNKCDVDEVDFIEYLAQDDETKVIAAYIESVKDGKKFFDVVSKATKLKPIIILKAGRSAAGAKAASSHTGALAGSDIAFDLAFKKAGVIRADTISDLFNYCMTFLIAPIPQGSNFVIITNAGGPGIVTTDAMEASDLGFARFSEDTINKLRNVLPVESNFYNPVDIIGDAPPERYVAALNVLLQCPDEEVAGGIVLLTPQAQTEPLRAAKLISQIHESYPYKTLVASFIGGVSVKEASKFLISRGVPTYPFPEEAVKVLKGLEFYGKIQKSPLMDAKTSSIIDVDKKRIQEIFDKVRKDKRTVLLSYETSEVFDIYKIKSPKSRLAQTARDAGIIASEMGYPVVMKIVSPQIIHKWDCGGVILNIKSEPKAREAFIQIMSNAKAKGPSSADLRGVEVQEMITREDKPKINELIFGVSRDSTWGPQIMVGSGGIYANYVKDVEFALAYYYDREDALNQLKKTNIYKILQGVRGEPRSDIEGVVEILLRLSQLVNDFDDIVELDINPCLIFDSKTGYSAVDIKITIAHKQDFL